MSANGISHLQSKAERQRRKLELAAINRAATGRRSNFDITELPTVYAPNNNDATYRINNPNIGGLIVGRPWLTGGMVEGSLWRTQYPQTYYEWGTSIYDTPPITSEAVEGFVLPNTVPEYCTFEFRGYFRANWTGTWTFLIDPDDAAALWIGPSALDITNINTSTALINIPFNAGPASASIDLVEGNVYPIRLLFANGPGNSSLSVEWINDLTSYRLLSLDAAVNLGSTSSFDSTDEYGFPGYGSLVTPGVTKSTEHGGSIVFDGNEKTQVGHGYVKLSEDFNSNFSSGISISVWANVSTGSGIWSRLIDFGNGSENDNILIAVFGGDPTKMCMQMWNGGSVGTDVQILGDIAFNEWKLYTLVGDGTNYYWYVNDQLVNTLNNISFLPNNVTRTANWCRIGGSDWETINDWNLKGSIASVEIYSRSLSISEVAGLFNERKGRFGL